MVWCSKCNRKIKNLETNYDGFSWATGMDYAKILCSVCDRTHKIVKRPIKRKLTKREEFEIALFLVFGIIILAGSLIGLICSIVIETKEGKGGGQFPGLTFSGIVVYIVFKSWLARVKRLEKEKHGKCCDNGDCSLKEE